MSLCLCVSVSLCSVSWCPCDCVSLCLCVYVPAYRCGQRLMLHTSILCWRTHLWRMRTQMESLRFLAQRILVRTLRLHLNSWVGLIIMWRVRVLRMTVFTARKLAPLSLAPLSPQPALCSIGFPRLTAAPLLSVTVAPFSLGGGGGGGEGERVERELNREVRLTLPQRIISEVSVELMVPHCLLEEEECATSYGGWGDGADGWKGRQEEWEESKQVQEAAVQEAASISFAVRVRTASRMACIRRLQVCVVNSWSLYLELSRRLL